VSLRAIFDWFLSPFVSVAPTNSCRLQLVFTENHAIAVIPFFLKNNIIDSYCALFIFAVSRLCLLFVLSSKSKYSSTEHYKLKNSGNRCQISALHLHGAGKNDVLII